MGSTHSKEDELLKIQKQCLLPESCEFIFDYTYSDRENAFLGLIQKGIELSYIPIIPQIISRLFEKQKLDDMAKFTNLVEDKINFGLVKTKRRDEFEKIKGIETNVSEYKMQSQQNVQKSVHIHFVQFER